MYYKEDLEQGWLNLFAILMVMLLQVCVLADYFKAVSWNVEFSENAIIWYSLLLFGCFMEFFNIISHSTDSSIPNSRHIWMSFGGAVLVGGSLVGLSLILSRIEKKLSARGQLDGRIKRDLIMAKIPLVSWTALSLLPIVLEGFNAKTNDDTLLEPNELDRGVELNSLEGFLAESGLIAAKLLWVAAVSFFFAVSGTYGACVGVGVGFVLRLWRLVATLIAVPWKSDWEWIIVSWKGCFIDMKRRHLWADLAKEQRHNLGMVLCIILIFNFRWSVFQVANDAAALETKTQNKDGKLGEMYPAAKEGEDRELCKL